MVWHRGGEDFYRTMSTAAIADGVLYISSLSGFLHALDPQTGEYFWTYGHLRRRLGLALRGRTGRCFSATRTATWSSCEPAGRWR